MSNSPTMKIRRTATLLLLTIIFTAIRANGQSITTLQQSKSTSIRGLSVVDDKTAWVSGSKGHIGITADGGKTWTWQQVKDYEKADFRDIEAFSDKEAVIMSSGTPALILKTADGGKSWQHKYTRTDSAYFLDAMDFKDKQHGWILGDPIAGKMLLLNTVDGGDTWQQVANAPIALPNEASFAASGTCLRTNGTITIVTGGGSSRIIMSPINKIKWTAYPLPLTAGKPSEGAFSFATGNGRTIIVGGDYINNRRPDSTAYVLSQKRDKTYAPSVNPAGFQSCVEYLSGNFFLSTGTSGSNFTKDGGKTWEKINDDSYNVCRKAKHGNLVLLAGDGGRIGIFKM